MDVLVITCSYFIDTDGVLKLFDPFFYRRVARRESAVIITNVLDMHVCARLCLDAAFPCGVFEYYIAGTIIDVKNQTKPVYDCLIDGPIMEMVHLSTPESKRINFHQFVRKMDISGMFSIPLSLQSSSIKALIGLSFVDPGHSSSYRLLSLKKMSIFGHEIKVPENLCP